MFDTNIVVIGNVLTAPEWRKTANSGHLVANFRIASTSRRLDRETGRWVDGNSLRVRVVCWRKLAEGIASSLTVGDPVVVTGKLYTRDWIDGDNNARISYEMEAVAVGHDLARGRGRFYRNRASAAGTVETDGLVRGEAAELVPEENAPAAYGDGVPGGEAPTFDDAPGELDPVTALIGSGLDLAARSRPAEDPAADPTADPTADPAADPTAGPDPLDDELEITVEAITEERAPRPRRPSRRQPVPA